jgi:hypothetical protein
MSKDFYFVVLSVIATLLIFDIAQSLRVIATPIGG